MNIIEAAQKGMRQLAEQHSHGEGIDEHWQAVLPEVDDIMANEIFLALNAPVVNQSMKCQAAQIAEKLPLPEVAHMDDAELYLRVLVRETWLGMADVPEFQTHVNEAIHVAPATTPDQRCIGWAKINGLWRQVYEGDYTKVVKALAERFRQYLFAQSCYGELMQRHRGKKVSKYVWALLHRDSEVLTPENREEAYKWLAEYSSKATNELTNTDSSDAMHNWLEKLLEQPTHRQMLKMRATFQGIQKGAIDQERREGRYQHISSEKDELVGAIADESQGNPGADSVEDNLIQNLEANQEKVEAILDSNPKIAKRRYQVLRILTHDPDITDREIAKRLGVSNQTIGRDRRVMQENRSHIQNLIQS